MKEQNDIHNWSSLPLLLAELCQCFVHSLAIRVWITDIGSIVFHLQVKGTVFCVDANGALVDITAKSSAYLPVYEASIHKIKHVEEAGIVPGLKEEFVIIGENEADDSLILSLKTIQLELAWERCRQLQAEDVVVKGKVSKFTRIC